MRNVACALFALSLTLVPVAHADPAEPVLKWQNGSAVWYLPAIEHRPQEKIHVCNASTGLGAEYRVQRVSADGLCSFEPPPPSSIGDDSNWLEQLQSELDDVDVRADQRKAEDVAARYGSRCPKGSRIGLIPGPLGVLEVTCQKVAQLSCPSGFALDRLTNECSKFVSCPNGMSAAKGHENTCIACPFGGSVDWSRPEKGPGVFGIKGASFFCRTDAGALASHMPKGRELKTVITLAENTRLPSAVAAKVTSEGPAVAKSEAKAAAESAARVESAGRAPDASAPSSADDPNLILSED